MITLMGRKESAATMSRLSKNVQDLMEFGCVFLALLRPYLCFLDALNVFLADLLAHFALWVFHF